MGYSAIWTNEIDRWDAFSLVQVASATTTAPLLGTAIATALTRGPALLAMEAAAASEASEGRLVLGIGPGSPVTVGQWNGLPFDRPVARMAAVVGVVRRLLAGERVSDETFVMRGFRLATPPPHRVSIFVSASRAPMIRMAARHADGLLLSWVSPGDVRTIRGIATAANQGRDEPLQVMASVLVAVSGEPSAERQRIKRQMIASLAVPTYRGAQAELGRGARLQPAWDAWDRGDRTGAEQLLPDSVVDDLVIVGDVASCVRRLREYAAAGVDHLGVAVATPSGSAPEVLASLEAISDGWPG